MSVEHNVLLGRSLGINDVNNHWGFTNGSELVLGQALDVELLDIAIDELSGIPNFTVSVEFGVK